MITLKAPTSVELFLTAHCNLSCTHCFATVFANSRAPELTTAEWKMVITRLSSAGVFRIGLTGGELFTRKDSLELLAFAKSQSFKTVTLGSNATLITRQIAAQLKALHFQTVFVSVDGDEAANDEIRGKGSFKKITNGIRSLTDAGIESCVLFTVMRGNYQSLPRMIDTLLALGVSSVLIHDVNGQGRCDYDVVALRPDDWKNLNAIVNDIRTHRPTLSISIDSKAFWSYPEQSMAHVGPVAHLKPCSAADTSCCITPTGQVIACPPLMDLPAGNILDNDFLEIWRHSNAFDQLRHLRDMPVRSVPECRECRYHTMCTGGCRGKAYLASGSLLGPDPDCPFWERQQVVTDPHFPIVKQ